MKSISVALPMITPSQIVADEDELRRRRIDFSVVHDETKQTSLYVINVRSDAEMRSLPAAFKRKLGVV